MKEGVGRLFPNFLVFLGSQPATDQYDQLDKHPAINILANLPKWVSAVVWCLAQSTMRCRFISDIIFKMENPTKGSGICKHSRCADCHRNPGNIEHRKASPTDFSRAEFYSNLGDIAFGFWELRALRRSMPVMALPNGGSS